jgi:hypothetical protein
MTMKPNSCTTQGWVFVLATLCGGFYSPAEAQHRPWVGGQQISSAAVACYFVGRAFLNSPVNGQGEVIAYFTNINGIPGPLFKGGLGAASEKTAFFTLRSDVFSTTSLPLNGDVAPGLVSAGKFSIYFNPSPNGDWSNPDTFSGGQPFLTSQPIASFTRPESLVLQILQTDSATPPPFESMTQHALTGTLLSSQSFVFNGHSYDLGALMPDGITVYETVSNTGVAGVTGFPIGLAYAGHCLGVGSEDQDQR